LEWKKVTDFLDFGAAYKAFITNAFFIGKYFCKMPVGMYVCRGTLLLNEKAFSGVTSSDADLSSVAVRAMMQ
jgi:hypothetical protein